MVAVAAAVDGHEIGGGGERCQAICHGDLADTGAGGDDLGLNLREPALVGEGGEGPGLGNPGHAEMIADLVESQSEVRVGNRVADAGPGEAVTFGEGAQADHLGVVGGDLRDRAGRGKVGVGFVEEEQGFGGQVGDQVFDHGSGVVAAHRVVGVGEVEEACPGLTCGGEEGVRVLKVPPVGNAG